MNFPITRRMLVVFLLLIFAGMVRAQEEHEQQLMADAELDDAISERSNAEEAGRAAIRSVLRRTEVRNIAEQYGLDVSRAAASAALLDGAELNRLAAQARQIDQELAGGDFVDAANNAYTIFAIVVLVIAIIYLLSNNAFGL